MFYPMRLRNQPVSVPSIKIVGRANISDESNVLPCRCPLWALTLSTH